MIKLRLAHPRIGERIVELSNGGIVVGREGARIDLALDWDPRVSRRHARFTSENGKVYVEDLKSKNGTWDGETRIVGRRLLEAGDSVIVGETSFSLAPAVVAPAISDPLINIMAAYVAGTDDLPREVEEEEPLMALPPAAVRSAPASPPTVWHSGKTPKPTPPRPKSDPFAPVIVSQPAREDKEPLRSFPRFVAEKKVGLRLGERSELKTLWTENISKGGLFVRTDNPLPRGTSVEVVISTPDGEVALRAEVVHVVDRATAEAVGHPPGVGLAFVDVRAEHRRAIHLYVDGIADRLTSDDVPRSEEPDRASVDAVLSTARELINRAESNDLYGALGVEPTINSGELNQRVQNLRQQFSSAITSATPPQIARLNAALKLLDRTGALMSSPQRRLEYDFRRGEVRADERMEQARQRTGPTVPELRAAWLKAYPERLERSTGLTKVAFEMRKGRDLLGAIRHGRQALELDPFHEELRQTIKAWAEMVQPTKKEQA